MTLLGQRYQQVRAATLECVQGLSDADLTAQSADFASPSKWHLAHTSWFFEQFVLAPHEPTYPIFDAKFSFLFNSYYEAVGVRHQRSKRGLLTRPGLDKVLDYRRHVDQFMQALISRPLSADLMTLIDLGLAHEQQHQELIFTDLLHLFSLNPLKPAARPGAQAQGPVPIQSPGPLKPTDWVHFDACEARVGHAPGGFHFDHEGPRHAVLLRAFKLASRPVSNRDWLAFMKAGGYQDPSHWLSDGWAHVTQQAWQAPLYWEPSAQGQGWCQMTLRGLQRVRLDAPVAHVSYFEAQAYARWANKRLPTEFEWEHASCALPVIGNFAERGNFMPMEPADAGPLSQMYGDVWEWTASPFIGYPGFQVAHGAIGEYNGKFMNGQYVLRGGSCVSPQDHLRASYRNFFQPEHRWQFSGLRLAEDV